jgi:hypothetical protein
MMPRMGFGSPHPVLTLMEVLNLVAFTGLTGIRPCPTKTG